MAITKEREAYIAQRALIPQRAQRSARASAHVLTFEAYRHAQSVMLYASMGAELDTGALLAHTLQAGKHLLLPRCVDARRMEAVCVSSLEQLVPGRLGILTPHGALPAWDARIDLALVPGLAFDACGNRIGYGAGYYDRFLAQCACLKAGLCFSAQVLDIWHPKLHDVAMDVLITEEGIWDCNDWRTNTNGNPSKETCKRKT